MIHLMVSLPGQFRPPPDGSGLQDLVLTPGPQEVEQELQALQAPSTTEIQHL